MCLCLLWSLDAGSSRAALLFTTGDYFTSNPYYPYYQPNAIDEFDSAGTLAGTLSLPAAVAGNVRGIAFGPDGLLYTTVALGTGSAVLALDRFGNVRQTYAMPSLDASLSGAIAVDDRHIFVSVGSSLMRFDLGQPSSGRQIYSQTDRLTDQVLEPGGNLFVSSYYGIAEITADGTVLRTLAPDSTASQYLAIEGLAFNPAANQLFVTATLSGTYDALIVRLDAATGAVEKTTTFAGGGLVLTLDGKLLVGTGSGFNGLPQFFTQDLQALQTLGFYRATYVAQRTVPETSALALLALPFVAAALARLRCA